MPAPLLWTLLAWLLAVAETDRRTGRIPNALVLPGAAATLACAAVEPTVGYAAVAAVAPYLVAYRARACGGGDVKFAVPCGGLAGDPVGALVMVVLAALGTLVAACVTRRRQLPHGPAMAVAAATVMILR